MADPWTALDSDDGAAAAGPRRLEHFTAPSSLAEQASSDNGGASGLRRSPAATPGRAGHRALAALAAELAEAAAVDGADAGPDAATGSDHGSSAAELRVVRDPAPGSAAEPSVVNGGAPGVDTDDPGAGGERSAGSPGSRLLPRLPLPGARSGMRLPDTGQNGAAAPPLGAAMRLGPDRTTPGGPEQSTITLRRRPITGVPASVAPAPVAPAPAAPDVAAPATVTSPPAAGNVAGVEAWSAHEDDILPRRQVRRSRPLWRRR